MIDKIMVLLGLVFSALLFYFCINFKGDNLVQKVADKSSAVSSVSEKKLLSDKKEEKEKLTKEVKETPSVAPAPVAVPKEEILPTFKYIQNSDGNGFEIDLLIREEDKNSPLLAYIEEKYQSPDVSKNIEIKNDVKNASWQGFALYIIKFFEDKGVKNRKLIIEGHKVIVEGIFPNKESFDSFKKFLAPFEKEPFVLEDKTYVMVPDLAEEEGVKEDLEIKNEENIQNQPQAKEEITEEIKKIKETESKIAKMLQMEPVRFKLNSAEITAESQKTLQKAIELLDSLGDDVLVEVAGYTDARGDANYNLTLSQRRAEAVKKYLETHMKTKKNMIAKGYGESHFVSQDPNDKRNRRVEIHLMKEGE